jgi:hypothetical protein
MELYETVVGCVARFEEFAFCVFIFCNRLFLPCRTLNFYLIFYFYTLAPLLICNFFRSNSVVFILSIIKVVIHDIRLSKIIVSQFIAHSLE